MEKRTLATPGSRGAGSSLRGGMRCLLRLEWGQGIRNRGVFVSHEMYVPDDKEKKIWRAECDKREKESTE